MAKESFGAVCDENLNSACDQMTLQCFANKFILNIQLGSLFRAVFIDKKIWSINDVRDDSM